MAKCQNTTTTDETTTTDIETAIERLCEHANVQHDETENKALVTFSVTDDREGEADAATVLGRLYASEAAVEKLSTYEDSEQLGHLTTYQVWLIGSAHPEVRA